MEEAREFVTSVRIRQGENGAKDLKDGSDYKKNEHGNEEPVRFDLAGIIPENKVIAAVIDAAGALCRPDYSSADREEEGNESKQHSRKAKCCK